jgi:hypothetical protein
MLETITAYLESALKSRQTGSALTPLLWLNGIVTVPCLLLAAFVASPMNIAFFVLAVVMVAFSLFQYQILVKKDPRLVQSEQFQFELAKLDLVAQKGGNVVFDPVNIEFSAAPPPPGKTTEEAEQ